jgi:hypothetical protein
MAVWAMLNWVASLPWAFSTVNWDDVRPASVRASFRYGASNSTYRLELTVSGRIAATLPLPAATSGFRLAMAEKVLVRSLVEIETELAVELLELQKTTPTWPGPCCWCCLSCCCRPRRATPP